MGGGERGMGSGEGLSCLKEEVTAYSSASVMSLSGEWGGQESRMQKEEEKRRE